MTVSEPSEVQGERWIVRNGEIRTDGSPYHRVASITVTNNDVKRADARARLIAAAPDLLKALEGFVAAFDAGNIEINSQEIDLGDGTQPHPWHEEWLHRARALLSSTRKDERA